MKKSLIFVGLLAVGYANAQEERVGINTENPSATLNVKTKVDSKSPKNLELENQAGTKLVTVLNNGNMGLGSDTPAHKLHIESAQLYPILLKNTRYAYNEAGMNNAIVLKDKDGEAYGYIGDASSHKRVSLIGQKGYQVTLNSTHETTKDGATIHLNSESTVDRIVVETVNEEGKTSKTYVDNNGNWRLGVSTPATEKLEVGGNIRSTTLAGTGDRPVYADENGVLKIGTATSSPTPATNGVQNTTGMACNDENRGKMNFGRISIGGKETDAMGFCMKNGDNEFRWYYIYGGAAHTVGTNATFGQGL